jgi:soluble lytic murein transglycosylase-like protein
MNPNRSTLRRLIDEKNVIPADRARLYPDTGIAYLSNGYYKYGVGSTKNEVNENFFQGLARRLGDAVISIFHLDGLAVDEIIVDVLGRTPAGNYVIPNLRLNLNSYDQKQDNSTITNLKAGYPLMVKISYDGGRAAECTPISWVFDHPSAAAAVAEIKGADASGIPLASDNQELNTMYIASGSNPKLAFVTDHPNLKAREDTINKTAQTLGLDANLIAGMILTESGGQVDAISRTGAVGLMQIEPGTFEQVYKEISSKYSKLNLAHDRNNPTTSIFCGSYYLKSLLDKYHNDYVKAITAYNFGPGSEDWLIAGTGLSIPPASGSKYASAEANAYYDKVKTAWTMFSQRSQKLALSKIEQRPESSKTDKTKSTAQSSQALLGKGAG